MPAGFAGRDAALYKELDDTADQFSKVAGVRTTSMTLNNEPVDTTSVDSEGFRELLPDAGVQSMDVTLSGIVKNSTTYQEVQEQAIARTVKRYQYRSANGDRWECDMAVVNLQKTGEYNGAETFSISLQSDGAIEFGTGS